ncbi:hypothetical protein [Streptomyces sp. Je 1-369]|uniref:hypothetical protein n=1 Tax=Streptomyces sp. Je 1-369 TaxID=2966192 RepID=UPI00228652A3|nr:hypothetical protein [Streptomyces sp. Je 1-369]WAL96879.1 hypothetical protein NOO62_21760 [Streptomyces sp. Je 1-369]
MTSARRLIAAVSLAAGAAALSAPAAQASAPVPAADEGRISVLSTVDDLATAGMPEEQRAQMPRLANQLAGLNRLNDLNQLHQITDLVAPVTNLVQ